MKKRPSLVLREPVKLYEAEREVESAKIGKREVSEKKKNLEKLKVLESSQRTENLIIEKNIESVKEKMSPRVRQIWDYFCKKAQENGELQKSFNLTRAEVMKEAEIGSTNTYRDALRKFQELELLEIELRPGVNSGSIFTLTAKGIEQVENFGKG